MHDPSSDLSGSFDWLRAFALRLTGDPSLAEDLAQDALVTALEKRGRVRGQLRPWLRAVLLNRFRQQVRDERSRRDLEREAGRGRSAAGAEAGTSAEHLERLRDALLRLREPYRSTVILRYGDGLSVDEISERTGAPRKTVESRLRRGLAELHLRLTGRSRGGRLRALVPWIGISGRRRRRALAWAGAGAAVVTVAAVFATRDVSGDRLAARPSRPLPERAEGHGAHLSPAPDEPGRVAAHTGAASPDPSASRATPTGIPAHVRGIVLDSGGAPLAGARVHAELMRSGAPNDGSHAMESLGRVDLDDGRSSVATDAEGRFAIPLEAVDPPRFLRLGVEADGGLVEAAGSYVLRGALDDEHVLVVAPARDLAGRVADERGVPVAGATVRLAATNGIPALTGRSTPFPAFARARVETDAGGRFRFGRVPVASGFRLSAAALGHESSVLELDGQPASPVELVLERERERSRIGGRVVDARGEPVEGGVVVAGPEVGRCAPDGSFELEVESPVAELWAVGRGFLPAAVALDDAAAARRVEIVLDERPLAIASRVLDGRGRPVAGVQVWTADPTPMGERGKAAELAAELIAAPRGPEGMGVGVETDAEGRFRLGGLASRPYRIRVADPRTLAHVDAELEPGAAPSAVRLAVPDPAPLEGVVVDADGRAVAGAVLQARIELFDAVRWPGARRYLRRGPIHADAEGRFSFGRLARAGVEVELDGDGLAFTVLPVPEERFAVLRAARAVRLYLSGPRPPSPPARVLFLDAHGGAVPAQVARSSVPRGAGAVVVRAGEERELVVPEHAAAARIEVEGAEPVEVPLRVGADGVARVSADR